MATEPSLDAILAILFAHADPHLAPPRRTWAVLDGARDERIASLVASAPAACFCLYKGELDPRVAAVAPWLVELPSPHDPWVRTVVADGWGRAWGFFLDTPANDTLLQRHLRSFLRVRDESGRKLLFRYYDPRVLRVFLPTLRDEDARAFAGPVLRFVCESADGRSALVDAPATGALVRREIPLDLSLPARSPEVG